MAHWKQKPNGHKTSCRKDNEFRQGDNAVTLQRFGDTCPGQSVILLENQAEKKWLVSSILHGDKCVLSEKQLRVHSPLDDRCAKLDRKRIGRHSG